MDSISVNLLYEQVKKSINETVVKSQMETKLPSFLIVSALKEIICKYETDARTDLVKDYQLLISEISKKPDNEDMEDKEE